MVCPVDGCGCGCDVLGPELGADNCIADIVDVESFRFDGKRSLVDGISMVNSDLVVKFRSKYSSIADDNVGKCDGNILPGYK